MVLGRRSWRAPARSGSASHPGIRGLPVPDAGDRRAHWQGGGHAAPRLEGRAGGGRGLRPDADSRSCGGTGRGDRRSRRRWPTRSCGPGAPRRPSEVSRRALAARSSASPRRSSARDRPRHARGRPRRGARLLQAGRVRAPSDPVVRKRLGALKLQVTERHMGRAQIAARGRGPRSRDRRVPPRARGRAGGRRRPSRSGRAPAEGGRRERRDLGARLRSERRTPGEAAAGGGSRRLGAVRAGDDRLPGAARARPGGRGGACRRGGGAREARDLADAGGVPADPECGPADPRRAGGPARGAREGPAPGRPGRVAGRGRHLRVLGARADRERADAGGDGRLPEPHVPAGGDRAAGRPRAGRGHGSSTASAGRARRPRRLSTCLARTSTTTPCSTFWGPA